MEFDCSHLVAADGDRCCICYDFFRPGQRISVFLDCKHVLHRGCHQDLRREGFRRKCLMCNKNYRSYKTCIIPAKLVDERVLEVDKGGNAVVKPFYCRGCRNDLSKMVAYKVCTLCGSTYHVHCAWRAAKALLCTGCVELGGGGKVSAKDFETRLRIGADAAGPSDAALTSSDDSTGITTPSSSGSGGGRGGGEESGSAEPVFMGVFGMDDIF